MAKRRIRKNVDENGPEIARSLELYSPSSPSFIILFSTSLLEIYRFAMLVILISLEISLSHAPRHVANMIFEGLIKAKRCFLLPAFPTFQSVRVRARARAFYWTRETRKLPELSARKHDLCLPSPLQLWKLQLFSELFLHFVGKCAVWRFFRSTSLPFFFFFFLFFFL